MRASERTILAIVCGVSAGVTMLAIPALADALGDVLPFAENPCTGVRTDPQPWRGAVSGHIAAGYAATRPAARPGPHQRPPRERGEEIAD